MAYEKVLFGKDKKEGVKLWVIVAGANPDNGEAVISIVHGKKGGKMQTKEEIIRVGKQGRSALEQADFEAQARVKKQMDKGYRESEEELDELPLLAMLAGDYRKIGHRIKFPAYGSKKFDGVRCLVKLVDGKAVLESRTGQPYSVPHLEDELTMLMLASGLKVLDGEIYKHDHILQDITSAVKRTDTNKEIEKCQRKVAKEPDNDEAVLDLNDAIAIAELRDKLEFHIFDVPDDRIFTERLGTMQGLEVPIERLGLFHIVLTEYVYLEDAAAVKHYHDLFVSMGYEGIMIRNFEGLYESGKRSADLQKYKEFLDAEFLILRVSKDKEGKAVYVLKNDVNDEEFSCVIGSHKQRMKDVSGLNVGKLMTAKFQSRYDGTELPQFVTGVAIRDYE